MRYFTIKELCKSNTADKLGVSNLATPAVCDNLERLVINVLDPLRQWYGAPIYVNSGYRSEAVNRAVRGSKTSQHLTGEAVDITARSKEENKKLFEHIKEYLDFDQLIDERNFSWIHVSFSKNNRQQVLKL